MMAVIIRLQNLPLSANASSIRAFFQGLKIPDGGVNIVGGDDGDAFIAFSTDDDARQAMHLNGQKINGVIIKLLLSSKQEMQKIITDAQNGVLKRSAPVSIGEIQSDKRSITYYTPGSTSTRDNSDTPSSAKMRIIDHSTSESSFNRNLIYNNKENNVFDGPPRPSEFSYRMSKPIFPPNNMIIREDISTYRYDTPEYAEYNTNTVLRPPIFEDNVSQIHNLKVDSPILENIDNGCNEEKFLRKTLLPTPPIFDPTLRQMNDRYEQPPIYMNDEQLPPQFNDHEMITHIRPDIQIYDRPEISNYNRADMPMPNRREIQHHDREDMQHHDREDMQHHDREDMQQHDRPDMSMFDMQDMPIHDRSDFQRHERPNMPIHDRSNMLIQNRLDLPIHERPDSVMHDRPDLLMHERQDLPMYDRPSMSMYDNRDTQMHDRSDREIHNIPDVLYNESEMPYDRSEMLNRGRNNTNERFSTSMYDRRQMYERPQIQNRSIYDRNMPVHERHISMHDRNMSVHDRNMPAHDRNMPVRDRNMPVHDRNMPMHDRNMPVHDRNMPVHDRYVPEHNKQMHDRYLNDRSMTLHDRHKMSFQERSQISKNERHLSSMHNETRIPINDRSPISIDDRLHASNSDRKHTPIRDKSQLSDHDRSQTPVHERLQMPTPDRSHKVLMENHIDLTVDKQPMTILRKDTQTESNSHHDYTERPQWLASPKVPQVSTNENTVVRTALPPSIISPKTISDLFRNITILPKIGIKIEQDEDKRLTGYVYVKFINAAETAKALKLNSKVFRGIVVNVESQDNSEFDKVVDNEKERELSAGRPLKEKSPYYKDLCLEISNIPLDVTETDLKDYLNISINNKNLHFMKLTGSCYCLITATDETMMETILKLNGVTYRGTVIKIVAISKFQLQGFLSTKGRDVLRPKPTVIAQKYSEPNKTFTTCLKLENLSENLKASDIKQLLLPANVPLPNIILNKTSCVINLQNSTNCQNVIKDLNGRPDIKFQLTPITNIEFQSLKATYLNAFGGQKSVVNKEKRPNTDINTKTRSTSPASSVRIKNLPTTISTSELKDIIRNFEYQPKSIRICFENSRNLGEAILTFKNSTEAVDFKDEFHGMWYVKKELEVLLSEN